jgi:hypothetical protein
VAAAAAPVVATVAETAAPVVETVAETAVPVVETVATTVEETLSPVVEATTPVVSPVLRTLATTAAPVTTTTASAATTTSTAPVDEPSPAADAETATFVRRPEQVKATGRAVSAAAGGSLPARPPLAPLADTAPTPISVPAASAAQPSAPGSHAAPLTPRGLALAFLGGLLAVGMAAFSTSSAGTGGHAPSSPAAVTTRPFRLVAPAIRWRVRALADRLRPAPLVSPLELPG